MISTVHISLLNHAHSKTATHCETYGGCLILTVFPRQFVGVLILPTTIIAKAQSESTATANTSSMPGKYHHRKRVLERDTGWSLLSCV